jgi:hypothetical protein
MYYTLLALVNKGALSDNGLHGVKHDLQKQRRMT